MRRTAIAATFALAACGHAAPVGLSATVATEPAQRVDQLQDNSVLTQSVRALSDVVISEGYQLAAPLERGFLAPSARALRPFTLAANTCVAIVAVATPSIADLDTALYASDGAVLAEDDASDARPVVRFCSGAQAISAYLSLYAFQGTGTYVLAQLTRPAEKSDQRWSADATSVGSSAFLELVRTLRSRGYQDDGPGTELPIVAGAPLRIPNKVAAGQCYGVIADGDQLRVRLLDEEGHEVALGVGSRMPAALQYCAQRSGDFTLELSAQGDARHAHLLRMHAAQTDVGGVRAVWLGEPSAATGARASAIASAKVSDCSATPERVAENQPLAQGALVELPLSRTLADHCELIEAHLHDGLVRATLRVESATSRVLTEREVQGESGALRVCALPANARLVLVGRAGFGSITVERRACEN